MNPILAAVEIGGSGIVNQLVTFLILGLCVGIVYGIGWYFFSKPPFPPLAMRIWNGLFVLVGGLLLINLLMGMTGHGFIKW